MIQGLWSLKYGCHLDASRPLRSFKANLTPRLIDFFWKFASFLYLIPLPRESNGSIHKVGEIPNYNLRKKINGVSNCHGDSHKNEEQTEKDNSDEGCSTRTSRRHRLKKERSKEREMTVTFSLGRNSKSRGRQRQTEDSSLPCLCHNPETVGNSHRHHKLHCRVWK